MTVDSQAKVLKHLRSKPVFCIIEEDSERMCFSKVSLESRVTPNRRILETSLIWSPETYKLGWGGSFGFSTIAIATAL